VVPPIIGASGFCRKVMVTSSSDDGHGGLLIDHLNIYVIPGVPVKALEGLVGSDMLPPVPETILQAPVPMTGVLAARAVLVRPHIVAPV
jgi:hypothetical protein